MAAVIMAVLFGLVALKTIPIQLAPDVSRPVISIRTINKSILRLLKLGM